MLNKQLETIRRRQDQNFSDNPSNHLPNQLAYTFRTRRYFTPNILRKRLSTNLPGIAFEVEPVFQADTAPLHYLLTIPSITFEDIMGSPFEIAYALQKLDKSSTPIDLLDVEPAIELSFTDLQLDEISEDSTKATVTRGCFTPKDKKPTQSNPKGLEFNWALKALRVPEAREKFGVTGHGIKVAHIDTGIALHDELPNLDPKKGLNLFGDETGALDPLSDPQGFMNPGHGTATSSVLLSDRSGLIDGVAPDIDMLPVRAIRTVVRLTQWRVARAVELARKEGAHIITMSLGGIWSWLLKEAIRRAVKDNILVLAASGNCVGLVVYPARFKNCIAVAGTSPAWPQMGWPSESAWVGSCRGKSVDVSAPGQFVWCASRKPGEIQKNAIGAGEGTSFSVALVAGIAALWLQKHGRSKLIESLGAHENLIHLFRRKLGETARTMPPLGSGTGKGIVDALELLESDPWPNKNTSRAVSAIDDESLTENLISMMPADSFKNAKCMILEGVALEIQFILLKKIQAKWDNSNHSYTDTSENLKNYLESKPKLKEFLVDKFCSKARLKLIH